MNYILLLKKCKLHDESYILKELDSSAYINVVFSQMHGFENLSLCPLISFSTNTVAQYG